MPFVYPTHREMLEIEREFVRRAEQQRVGLQIMPTREVQAHFVQWTQKDNYIGLQQLRGLDGAPHHVAPVGDKSYLCEPGVFGEYSEVTETELTSRSGGVAGDPLIDVSDLVVDRQTQLIVRELDRIEQIIWALLVNGTFSVSKKGGGLVFTDTFTIQTISAAVAWSTYTTARPLYDFRRVALLGAGKGVAFNGSAKAYMNQVTANALMLNANKSDLHGKRIGGGNTVIDVSDVNRILLANDLPQIQVYDDGYIDDNGAFNRFIPTGKVVVVGARATGERVGEYRKTVNANNPNRAPGSYQYIIDRANGVNGEKRTPPNIEVHRGHNGGPVLYFPSAVAVLDTPVAEES